MKTAAIADLHDDFWADPVILNRPKARARHADALGYTAGNPIGDTLRDVRLLIVAGDLSNKAAVRWPGALARLRAAAPEAEILMLPGNHDYYQGTFDDAKLADIAAAHGARLVQAARVDVPGHAGPVRLLLATLWTDFALTGDREAGMRAAGATMNEFRCVRTTGYRKLSPADTAAVHRAHRDWIAAELARPFAGRTIVVTHHAPHPACLARRGGVQGPLDSAYCSDLSEILDGPHAPDLWLYGHVHEGADTVVGRTELRCISLGYTDEWGATPEARAPAARARIGSLVFDL